MPGWLTIFNAVAPVVLQGIKGKGAKDQRARIVFAVVLMRILACLESESDNRDRQASALCLEYITGLAPKGSDVRRQTFAAYKESLEVEKPESGDAEVIAAL